MREEEKIKKQRMELEQKYAQEKDSKKKKFEDVRESNKMMMGGKGGGGVQNTPPATKNKVKFELPPSRGPPHNDNFGPGP